jgi:hypothetical protein
MPKVTHVKSAQKDNPVCKKGESYYHWSFRYGGKHYSLTPPRGSQLTQSPHYSGVRSISEQIEDTDINEPADLEILRDEIVGTIRELGEAANDSRENMPEGLQQGDTGMMLEERYDTCEAAADELEGLDLEFASELDDDEDATQEDKDQERQEWMDELKTEMSEHIDGCEV